MKNARIVLVLLLLAALLAAPAAAVTVPEKPDKMIVADYANVLSDNTELYINQTNEKLYAATGGQIAVVTVTTIEDVSSENYAYTLFNEWGIGDKNKDNGFLILMVTDRLGYWMMAGTGAEKFLSAYSITDIAEGFLVWYDAHEFDIAATYAVDRVAKVYEAFYGVDLSDAAPKTLSTGAIVILFVIAVAFVLVLSRVFGSMMPRARGMFFGPVGRRTFHGYTGWHFHRSGSGPGAGGSFRSGSSFRSSGGFRGGGGFGGGSSRGGGVGR